MAQVDEFPTNIAAPERGASPEQLVAYVANLANIVARMAKSLEFVINGNIGDVNIKANSITALKMDVDELSAITANLGKITAGEIYGTHIATSETGYPRAEMSNTGKYFRAASNNMREIQVAPVSSVASTPLIIHIDGISMATEGLTNGYYQTFVYSTAGARYSVNAPDIELIARSGGRINLEGNVHMKGAFYHVGQLTMPLSTATTVEGLKSDFNVLLAVLMSMKLIG